MKWFGVVSFVLGVLLVVLVCVKVVDLLLGVVIFSNLEYVTWIVGVNGIVEGKFDEVRGKDVLVVIGWFGFKIYDVSDFEKLKLFDEFIFVDLVVGGYW